MRRRRRSVREERDEDKEIPTEVLPPGPVGTPETPAAEADDEVQRSRRNFVLGLLAAFAILSFLVFRPFVSYVFMGLLAVYLSYPLYQRVLLVVRSPSLASAAVLLLVVALIVAPLTWVGFEVVETVQAATADSGNLQESLVATVDRIASELYRRVGLEPPQDGAGPGSDLLAAAGTAIEDWARSRFGDVLSLAGAFTIGIVVLLFVLYYGLKDGPSLLQFVIDASPLDDQQDRELLMEVRKTVDAVFLGHIIVSAIQGALGGVGFLIFGVPNAVFWGFVMIVMSLVPLVGAFVVWMPAALWLLAVGQTVQGVGLILYGVLIVSTIDNVLRPKIVGSRADIHPVLVLIGVLGGLTAFGFIGFVLGPLVLAMFIAVVNFWRRDYLPQYEAQRRARRAADHLQTTLPAAGAVALGPSAGEPPAGEAPPREGEDRAG